MPRRKAESSAAVYPMLTMLKMCGLFPLSGDAETFRFLSREMLYSMVVYVTLMVLLVISVNLPTARYDEIILTAANLGYYSMLLVVPFTCWLDTPSLAQYFTSWRRFQTQYLYVTGKKVTFSTKKISWVLAILIPLMVALLEVSFQLYYGTANIASGVLVSHISNMRYSLCAFWYLLCRQLKDVDMAIRDKLCLKMVLQHRTLWLQFGQLSRQLGPTLGYTCSYLLLYLFVKVTFNTYLTLGELFLGSLGYRFLYIGLITLGDVALIFVLCDQAYKVSRKITVVTLKQLTTFNTDLAEGHAMKKEVKMFIRLVQEYKTDINLGGFCILNRRLFISIVSNMFLYLTILMQFKLSSLAFVNRLMFQNTAQNCSF